VSSGATNSTQTKPNQTTLVRMDHKNDVFASVSVCNLLMCRVLLDTDARHGCGRRCLVSLHGRQRLHGRVSEEPLVHGLRHEMEQLRPGVLLHAARTVVSQKLADAEAISHPLPVRVPRSM